ncbi:MAG: HNH endonuclease [Acidobacteriota bacterium]
MAFPPVIATEIRKRSHFQCCLCKAIGVEVHHIIPTAAGGSDQPDNAAPLCPSCHETYGANPTKRKFIREARDLWFEICQSRYGLDRSMLQDVLTAISDTASKGDILSLKAEISEAIRSFMPEKSYTITLPLKPRR